jgi:hypothetical protein
MVDNGRIIFCLRQVIKYVLHVNNKKKRKKGIGFVSSFHEENWTSVLFFHGILAPPSPLLRTPSFTTRSG